MKIFLFLLLNLVLTASSPKAFRKQLVAFSQHDKNDQEEQRINEKIQEDLHKMTESTKKINEKADDEYQFSIHRQISSKDDTYRKLTLETLSKVPQQSLLPKPARMLAEALQVALSPGEVVRKIIGVSQLAKMPKTRHALLRP